MLNALDLFSGIGGNSLALAEYCKTVAYCEADRHAQSVLLSRMSAGQLAHAPICTDVARLDGKPWKGRVDIIVAGFPCQDISSAGKGAGLEGERSGLFYEVLRLAKEVQPTFLFLENVAGIRTRGLDTIIQELAEAGYDCRWFMLSAAHVGAPHKRERWFLLANSANHGNERTVRNIPGKDATQIGPKEPKQNAPDKPTSASEHATVLAAKLKEARESFGWNTEPNVGRVVNGLPQRVDRIKRLGNAVVPEQAKQAFKILMGDIE